jgi:hypothetical protein
MLDLNPPSLSDIIHGRTPADGEKVLKITRQDLYLKSFCTQSRDRGKLGDQG